MTRRGPEITTRDLEILRWLTRHGVVTTEQLAARWFTTPSGQAAAWRRVRKLIAVGLLRRDSTLWKGAPWVLRVTQKGANLADIGVGPAQLFDVAVPHSLAVVDLLDQLLVDNPSAELTTERELRGDQWRSRNAHGPPAIEGRIPDGILRLVSADLVAVELDLTAKRSVKIREIIEVYWYSKYHTQTYKAVWWYVRGPLVAERIRQLVREESADGYIAVRPWTPP